MQDDGCCRRQFSDRPGLIQDREIGIGIEIYFIGQERIELIRKAYMNAIAIDLCRYGYCFAGVDAQLALRHTVRHAV